MLLPLEFLNSITISSETYFLTGINLGIGRFYQPNSLPKRPLSTTILQIQKPNVAPEKFGVEPSSSTTGHFAVSCCGYMLLWRNAKTVPNGTGNASCYFARNKLLQGPCIIEILEGLCQVICQAMLLRI